MDLPDSDWGDFSCRRAVDSSSFRWLVFKPILGIEILNTSSEIAIPEYHNALLIVSESGSGNGLVPSGTKPLPEPIRKHRYYAMEYDSTKYIVYKKAISE